MRRIDIFVSSPEDVQAERSLVERSIRSIAAEFSVPVTVTYSNWLRKLNPEDKIAAQALNGSEEGKSWLCPCFWEYQDFELDQEYRERIPNTGSFDLVISILWSRLGTKISPAVVMPDGSRPQNANDYEIAWVLDQLNRTPGFPELRVYRNRSTPTPPSQSKENRETFFGEWDAVQEFFSTWEKESSFAEACSDYSDLQDFENLVRAHFRDFLARQLEKEVVPRKRTEKARYWKSDPFRGLQFFDYEHAPVFHGRTKAVGEVLDALKKQANAKNPFVLVLGASGSGKSSLVRAGVLPLLTEIGTVVGDGPWRRAAARPGSGGISGDPFDALAVALLAKGALPELQRASRKEWNKLASELREHPEGVALRIKEQLDRISLQELDLLLEEQDLQPSVPGRIEGIELARHRRLRRVKPKAQLALVIDQLEDLFVNGFPREVQQRYFAVLAALVRSQRVFVVAALRSDFYAAYHQFPELVGLVGSSGQFDLLPPTRTELRSIIRLPAEAAGLSFERDIKTNRALDEALVDAAIVSAEPLPLLEHLLSQLYRKQLDRKDGLLRWSDYRESGEFEGALANHAETVFAGLSSDAQQTFEFVMRRLTSLGPDDKTHTRRVPYQELVSSPELDSRLRMGAKTLVDRLVQAGLFSLETDPKQEVFISAAHPALLRRWARVQLWIAEDQEFLRMRDRLDGCLKLWLNRGRQTHHLLSSASSLADGETLTNHFHYSLSETQIDYIKRSIAARKRGRRLPYLVGLPILVALVSLGTVAGVRWFKEDSRRKSLDEYTKLERKIAELAQSEGDTTQNAAKTSEERAQRAEQRADLAATQIRSIEGRLKEAEEKSQQNSDLSKSELVAAQSDLKKAEEKARQAQMNADLASKQRSEMDDQLKKAGEKAQLAQQSVDLATTQRAAMEVQLKNAEEKARQAQQKADLASTQRGELEVQLKKSEEKAQLAQQSADLATTQRTAMEVQLKSAEEKVQQAQQNTDLASTQRTELEVQLKKAEEKAQQAADLAATQRAAIEAQMKKTEEKAQLAQQSADLATTQRVSLEAQLKKAQQAQQNADLTITQRTAVETQLKQAGEKAQQAQQSADLAAVQRTAMEVQLKKAEEKAQLAEQNASLVSAQRDELEDQLKKAGVKVQQAQQSADLAVAQRTAIEAQLKKTDEKARLAQQNADLFATQRGALETQLKEAEEKVRLTQQSADTATNQRVAMETQLKQAEERARLAQLSADAATTQRNAMEVQLKKTEELAQQNADVAAAQRGAMELRLKEAEKKVQVAQQSADTASTQRSAMEAKLKQAEAKAQAAQESADLASTQRSAMEVQLKKAEEKAQLAQKIADLVLAQADAVQTGSSKAEPARKSADLPAVQIGSGRALPLDGGRNAEPLISTQPPLPPVQPANH